MTRPAACRRCATLVPAATPMARLGLFWLCVACASAQHVRFPCPEATHAWAGTVNDAGTDCWGCEACGAVLGHQAIDERVVEAAREMGYIDC